MFPIQKAGTLQWNYVQFCRRRISRSEHCDICLGVVGSWSYCIGFVVLELLLLLLLLLLPLLLLLLLPPLQSLSGFQKLLVTACGLELAMETRLG